MPRYQPSPGFRHSSNSSDYNESSSKNKNYRYNERDIRSLCLSNIPESIPDLKLSKLIDEEFFRFGQFQINIASHIGERVAYINFTHSNEAHEAMVQMKNFQIDSKSIFIKPIYVDQKVRKSSRSRSPVNRNKESHRFSNEKNRRSISPMYSRKDKMPYDNVATKKLFVGNLSNDIDAGFLLRKFEKFGKVQNIDIKRNSLTRNDTVYAFIEFQTVEMAIKAKRDFDGKIVNGNPLKIGYARSQLSTCVRIEGLGPWVSFEKLEKNILKLGNVTRISWPRNKSYAFIVFQSITDATNALDPLRNTKFSDKRITADFTDVRNLVDDVVDEKPATKRRSLSRKSSPIRPRLSLSTAESTSEVCDCLEGVWSGKIILKKNNFGCRFFILRGDEALIGDYLFEERQHKSKPVPISLNVTQTMSMDPAVMYDINDRLCTVSTKKFCVMFATSYAIDSAASKDVSNSPTKPIKHLIDYLKTKNSSGVIMLPHSSVMNKSTSMLHIIPPCDFVFHLLRDRAPKLVHKAMMDDFVLILLLPHVEN